ncbi:hypothetical protein AX16_010993 [Volvariella volvacea WC 439]|nr:hypothetical protein AX16_010993 [Volvariella volvacea WC 439]
MDVIVAPHCLQLFLGKPSPFASVLYTNHAPSSKEVEEINQLLVSPQERLMALDEELDRLNKLIDQVSSARENIRQYIDAHKALLSPIRRLPPEIITEIFVNCLPIQHNPVRSVSEAPLLLGRICSSWRRIALTTPRLWSGLHMVIPTHFEPSKITEVVKLRCLAANAWLERSGTLPISLSLVTANNGFSADVVAAPVLKTLIKFSSRWRSISLRVPYALLQPFSELTRADVPRLETLKIDDVFNWDQTYQWHFPLLAAPRLRSVSFVHFQGNPRNLPLAWPLLSGLSLDCDSTEACLHVSEVLDVFKRTPNLESCALGIRPPISPEEEQRLQHVVLPKLTTLTFRVYPDHVNELEKIFENIYAPNIKELSVVVTMTYEPSTLHTPHVPFRCLLAKSNVHLEKLDLVHLQIEPEAFIDCLRHLPRLKTLCITDNSFTWPTFPIDTPDNGRRAVPIVNDKVLQHLMVTSDLPVLCPKLESLTLNSVSAFSDKSLIEFARSRRFNAPASVSLLKVLQVKYTRSKTDDIRDDIANLEMSGMRISVTYPVLSAIPDYSDSPWEGIPEAHRFDGGYMTPLPLL